MTPEDKVSLLDLDIKKIELDLVKLSAYLQKMKDMRHEENLKLSVFHSNMDFLRKHPPIVSISEASVVSKSLKKLNSSVQLMDLEIAKLEAAHLSHRTACDNLIKEKNKILSDTKRGVVLQFRGRQDVY